MVGGIVKLVWRLPDRHVIFAQGTGTERSTCCAICVEPNEYDIQPGGGIWWQMDRAFWAPKPGSGHEIELAKIGYSTSCNDAWDEYWPQVESLCWKGYCPECGAQPANTMHDGMGMLWCSVCHGSYAARRKVKALHE